MSAPLDVLLAFAFLAVVFVPLEAAFALRHHRVHHTSERMDWLAAFREHPLDNLFTRLVENLPALLLGFPLASIAGFAAFRGLWALFIHSNTTLSPGPLRYVLGAPRLHRWHHEPEPGGRVNFANVSPLMDVLFGTWHDPGHGPARCGVREPVRRGFLAQLVDPLLPPAATHHRGAAVPRGAGEGSAR